MKNIDIVTHLLADLEAYALMLLENHPRGKELGITDENLHVFLAHDGVDNAKSLLLDAIDTSLEQKIYWSAWFNHVDSIGMEKVDALCVELESLGVS